MAVRTDLNKFYNATKRLDLWGAALTQAEVAVEAKLTVAFTRKLINISDQQQNLCKNDFLQPKQLRKFKYKKDHRRYQTKVRV